MGKVTLLLGSKKIHSRLLLNESVMEAVDGLDCPNTQ